MRTDRAEARFLFLYALANAGGVAAFLPLLTLLLPTKMAAAAGDARVEWLAVATFAGALSASLANVGWGWASDQRGGRRPWVAAGLVLTLASYGLIYAARTPPAIVGAVVLYQAALNMMLAPLAAWAADAVPDARKGLLGGLLGLGQPIAALVGVVVTLPFLRTPAAQLAAVCLAVAALVLPLLLFGVRRAPAAPAAARPAPSAPPRADFLLLWLSRLLVQVAGSVLFAFLLYYFQALPGRPANEAEVARISGLTLAAAVPLSLLAGRWSDRLGRRRPFLVGSGLVMSLGLAAMGARPSLLAAVAGYALFGCALTIFLSIQSAYAMQLLPSADQRGRDLGLFNLANTLPALLSPLLAGGLVTAYGFDRLMQALAVLTAVAAVLIRFVRTDGIGPPGSSSAR